MNYPNFREERRLWRKGYSVVVGLDESGRGPLAGPVVAAAVCFRANNIKERFFDKFSTENESFPVIKDSKKLFSEKRERIYQFLKQKPEVEWGIGRVSEKVIDKINILEATKLAMERAVKNLEKKIGQRADFLILDGNFAINLDRPQESIIKADEKVFLCVIAGIIAKVVRDRIMLRYHKKYPYYGFDRHKGYPTRFHRDMIKKNGFCPFHRKSFKIS